MKLKILGFLAIVAFSATAAAELLPKADGQNEALIACIKEKRDEGGRAKQCDLFDSIKSYNDKREICNAEIDGWFSDKPLSSVPECVEAERIFKEAHLRAED